ncbi:MAG: glycosyltransferase family 4 protein [Anaerolineae bacterium]|nr:glycosyltransferase family 4 protein [Anaerolineae bacterium]
MRIGMVTQQADPSHPLLGFTVAWIEVLASRLEALHLVTLSAPRCDLPSNVFSDHMGKGSGKLRMVLRYWAILRRILPRIDALFCHMVPRYAWLAAPLARLHGVPIVLWYVHRHVGAELRAALAVARAVATADLSSFPLRSSKVRVLGHGIDATRFAPDSSMLLDSPPLIVQVARLTPIKHQETLIRASAKLNMPHQIALIGDVPEGHDAAYAERLRQLTVALGIAERIHFTGALPQAEVIAWYRRATLAVNLSPRGLFDKAALEAMLCGLPTVVSNSAFDSLLADHAERLRINAPDDVDGLAQRLEALLRTDSVERQALGAALRKRTHAAHSLDGLADRLMKLFREVSR